MLSTVKKIMFARIASKCICAAKALFGCSQKVVVKRSGITWRLDLKEGIDFSIYILGGFEIKTLKKYSKLIKSGHIVLDIGANIGAHALPLAQLVGDCGKVIAFEPTDYAYSKLLDNITLNRNIAPRIDARQIMLVSEATINDKPDSIYSSWPLEVASDLDAEHLGRMMPISDASLRTLDEVMDELKETHVDFIKLDVDGNENKVLQGALRCIERFRPVIMMELAPYIFKESPSDFIELLDVFKHNNYLMQKLNDGTKLPLDAKHLNKLIPSGCSINVLLTPDKAASNA